MNHKFKILQELKQKNNYWIKVFDWFQKYTPQNIGMKFVHDSIFTEKYLQSKHMLFGMIKHILYLYRSYFDKNFEYEYNDKRINYIVQFFHREFKLSEGTFQGKPFKLEPNQVYKLSLMWGFSKKLAFKSKEEEEKGLIFMVNNFYDGETRKNGKSMFFAAIADFLVLNPFGNDFQPEIYLTGPIQKSSKIIYEKAQSIIEQNPKLKGEFIAVNLRRFQTRARGKIIDLPFDVKSLEGQNPSFTIATEYHLHDNDEMVNSMESASNLSRINSMLVFDTTKGYGLYGVAYTREHDYKELTKQQLDNPFKNIGLNIATFLAEVDEEDHPEDIDNPWESNPLRKSTPNLGVTISLKSLQDQWNIAKLNPTRKIEFLIKKFGKWIGSAQSILTLKDFNNCHNNFKDNYQIENFNGEEALIAVDLANTGDTNAVTLIFKDIVNGKEMPIFYSKIFIPEKTLNQRIAKEKKPYLDWIEKGWVIPSGDAAVDYADIASYIKQCLEKYKILKILFDPWQKKIIETYLIRENGISKVYLGKESEIKQAASTLSSTMEEYIKRIVDGQIYFFGNPVFIDHHINMTPSFNSQGQVYWTKQNQNQRIDIFSSCVTGMYKFNDLYPIKSEQKLGMEVWEW